MNDPILELETHFAQQSTPEPPVQIPPGLESLAPAHLEQLKAHHHDFIDQISAAPNAASIIQALVGHGLTSDQAWAIADRNRRTKAR